MEIDVVLMIEPKHIFGTYVCLASPRKLNDNGFDDVFAIIKNLIRFSSPRRRVHITKTTLDYLADKFEVEPGNGASREQYLADHKIDSYLIVPPKVS